MTAETVSFERYFNVRSAYGASFSADGSRLFFLTDITGVPEVWSVPVERGAERQAWPDQVTFRGERVNSAACAPNSDTLLVAGDFGGNELTQLFLASGDGATLRQLTTRPDIIHEFGAWSPDGTRILYTSNERDSRFFDVYERALDGEPRLVHQYDGTSHALRYSPDGRQALIAYQLSNTRNVLLLLDLASGETRQLTPEAAFGAGSHISPRFSPDGTGIWLLSDRDRQFSTLAWLDLASGEMTYLREDVWDSEELALTRDGSRLALITNVDGYSRLEVFDVSRGWEQRKELAVPVLPRAGMFHDLAWSPDGQTLAMTVDPPDGAPDVWLWDIPSGEAWQATHSATGGLPREGFVAPTLVHYPTFDGREIPAFLFLPQGVEPRNLPTVLYVHGGPEGQFRPQYMPVIQFFVAQGYAVLAPNVRGSTGYGYFYQSLDDVRKRMDSVTDLKYAVQWLSESGTADPKRIGIFGRSYGGFMVLSAITTYPDLWAAAVDIVGIANFVTFLERTGPWRRKLREAEYGSLENDRDFLIEISPLTHVERIVAPLFVAHGANDARVPVNEAEQIVAAVKSRQVPVEYLRFPDEGHQFTKRANQITAYTSIARFLDTHLRGE